jgi:hypothetical protein
MSARPARFAALATAALLLGSTPARAAEEGAGTVHAMRLAAIAERIAKVHVQAASGVLVERARRALGEALRDFDATLRAAAAPPASAEVRDNYLLLGLLWREYRGWAVRPATRETARKVSDRAEEVAWIAAKATRLQLAGASGGLTFAASQACALSQRVPRLHLMRRWDPRNADLARELAVASEELAGILERLAAAEQNTPEIEAHLQLARTQHEFLVSAAGEMHRPGASARHAENIAKTGDHILDSMERALRLYSEARL